MGRSSAAPLPVRFLELVKAAETPETAGERRAESKSGWTRCLRRAQQRGMASDNVLRRAGHQRVRLRAKDGLPDLQELRVNAASDRVYASAAGSLPAGNA